MSDTFDPFGISGSPEEIAKQLYGYSAWALEDPELTNPDSGMNVIMEAALKGWSPDMLKGALSKTSWWKTKSEAERNWENLLGSDNASAMKQISDKADEIRNELIQQGVNLDDGAIRNIAADALRFGMTDTQIKLALNAELQRSPSVLKSKIGAEYKALSRQYAVPMADATIQKWAADSISGVSSDEFYRQYLVNQAKARFQDPTLGKFLDAGGTVDQYADPYRQMASQVLGIDPNTVDFSDPKWIAAINVKDDKGNVRSMNYDEWTTYLKSDANYGWDKTNDAKAQAQQFVDKLGQAFGKVAN